MEIDNLIKNLQKVKDEGQNRIGITIGHEIHGEEGVREIYINVGFDSKITNPEEPRILCNNGMPTFKSSPIEVINKINQLPGFTARGIIAIGNIKSVLIEDDAKQIVVVPNDKIGQWYLDNLEEYQGKKNRRSNNPKILKKENNMQGYYKHLTNKEIPYGTLFDNEDGDWVRPFKPATKTPVQRKDLCLIERPNRKDFTDQCEVCGGNHLIWRFTDWDNDTNDNYYDCWDSVVHVFLYAIMNDPSGNFSIYATGACNCGHTGYAEGVLYNNRNGEDIEEKKKEEQKAQPWFDYNV